MSPNYTAKTELVKTFCGISVTDGDRGLGVAKELQPDVLYVERLGCGTWNEMADMTMQQRHGRLMKIV